MKFEEVVYIIEANIFDDFLKILFRAKILASLAECSEIVTEHAAIKLMSRIRDEGTGICQHTDTKTHRIEVRTSLELPLDAELLIIEPPWCAKLYL